MPPPIGGPRKGGKGPIEKAKDFKGAIIRLFTELGKFKIIIGIALILAILGAIIAKLRADKILLKE